MTQPTQQQEGDGRIVAQASRFVDEQEGRATFRGKCEGEAWQKQLRDKYMDEPPPPVKLSLKKAKIVPVSRAVAAQIIFKYEWLGTMAATSMHHGLFFGPYCAGVTCAGVGCTGGTNTHKMFGLERNELITLARGANVHWAPTGSNSKLVSWTCRLLQGYGKLIIAYADTDAGEIGTIYQACGWHYIGKGSATRQWVSPEGRVLDQKLPSNLSNTRGGSRKRWVAALKKAGWIEQISNPKHRYCQIIDKTDKRLAALIKDLEQPYPKRLGDSAAAASKAGTI